MLLPLALAACASVDAPDGRSAQIPTATPPQSKPKAVNDRYDPITRVRLGRDIFVPRRAPQDPLPEDFTGPLELRGESLASALQIVLDDYDISLAFESDLALQTRISVANLRGPVSEVVDKLCALANLYCHFQDGMMTVKDTETFIVDLPPVTSETTAASSSEAGAASESASAASSDTASSGGSSGGGGDANEQIASGLESIVGSGVVVDSNTRVIIYRATQRTQHDAERYFDRLRKNMALIVFETHIWEVTLDNSNRTGIDWSLVAGSGNFDINIGLPGGAPSGTAAPITITPDWTGSGAINPETVLEFISEHGTVRTISQPQLTVLSGSQGTLEVTQTENYVSSVSRTPSTVAGQPDTVSTVTGTLNTGLTITIDSAWDRATVYGSIAISIADRLGLDEFTPDESTTIQLPRTSQRSLSTAVRVRPGDAILIAGLVAQKDDYSASGPGFMKPLFPSARRTSTRNSELVFLLRPRVVVFEPGEDDDSVPVSDMPRKYSMSAAQGEIDRLFNAPPPAPAAVSADVSETMPAVEPETAPSPPPLPDGVIDMMPVAPPPRPPADQEKEATP